MKVARRVPVETLRAEIAAKVARRVPVETLRAEIAAKPARGVPVETLRAEIAAKVACRVPAGTWGLFSLLSGIGLRHVAEVGILVEHAAGVLGTECQRTGQRGYQIP